jgi:Secretion system C-terminal sorting domain/FG-GAP-like repeat
MKKILLLSLLLCLPLFPQVPFMTSPNWTSSDSYNVSTGAAFADINNDGWLDFVTANGNDISRQTISVYYNDGTGNFPTQPSWNSTDIDYHGHLDVGDVNHDGWIDVVVSVYLGPGGFGDKGRVKLYLNNEGTLSPTADWQSSDVFYTFSCALGDADNDGDLDLAVATGESYTSSTDQFRIYYNNGGTFESTPSWESQQSSYAYDINWFDVDNDGDLDLVFACEQSPNKIFLNNNGIIETTPSWQSSDASQQANSLAIGDVNDDGYLDLAISDNNQLGGQGRFKIYLNNNGQMSTTPFWTSSFSGYGSGIFLHDLNSDGYDDLITGGWWEPIRIYMNNAGSFTSTPQYTSSTGSVIEVIVMGDINKDGDVDSNFVFPNSGKKLFYIPNAPLQSINYALFDNDTVSISNYCYNLESGWISFNSIPVSVNNITVNAVISYNQDIGITNWDSNIGNYLFYNQNPPVPVELNNFTAKFKDGSVVLEWNTSSETNDKGFEIERLKDSKIEKFNDWENIGFVEGSGTTTQSHSYSFVDKNVSTGNYSYRLKQTDFDGTYKYSNTAEVEISKPFTYALQQNYPNPFNPSTKIKYSIAKEGKANLKVYDILGREVATLVNEYKQAGKYEVEFNAANLPSGVYFYKLEAGNYSQVKKMVLLK